MDEANSEDQMLNVPELPPGKLFHIFFSYAENDRQFTCRLIDKLENELKLKCCEHTRDFIPGWPVIDNIKHCVMSSLKTVVIVSPESVKSQWCSYESEMTLHLSMDMRRKILIPMIIDDCTIPDHLMPLTYIDARGDAAQWWPKLLRAIESPAEVPMFESGLPVLSSEPFSFNLHYSNLDTLVNLESKRRSCMHEEIRSQIVPYSLCREGIQVPHVVFEEQMTILNRSTLFNYHCCFYQRIGWIICLSILWIALSSTGFSFTLGSFCPTETSCYFFKCLGVAFILAPVIAIVVFIVLSFKRNKKEKTLLKILSEINARFLPYQVMLTYKSRRSWTRGFTDYTQSCLQKAMKSSTSSHRLQVTSETISNSQGILAEDPSDQTPLLEGPSENLLTTGIRMMNENSNKGLEQISKDILLRYSAEYLRLFLDENLQRPELPRHTIQVECLCQYVENMANFQSCNQSRNIIEL